MKTSKIIALLIMCSLSSLNAQETTQKIKIYETWVSLNMEPFKIKGALYEIKDSSITITNSLKIEDYSINNFEMVNVHVKNIGSINIRRKGSVVNGIIGGALTGLIIGVAGGLLSGGDNCPPGSYCLFTAKDLAIIYGVSFAALGTGIGAAIGSVKVKIPINRSNHNYKLNNKRLKEYAFR